MKLRHNKKRNTAFLYETLVKELTKSVVNNDVKKKKAVLSILKEHFKKGSALGNELTLYRDVLEKSSMRRKWSIGRVLKMTRFMMNRVR